MRTSLLLLLVVSVPTAAGAEDAPFAVTFSHVLSDFGGAVPVGEASVAVDPERQETFVAEGRDVHVFNEFGMEVHGFLVGPPLGPLREVVALPDGGMVLLAYDMDAPGDEPRAVLSRRDFRGAFVGELELTGVPAPYSTITPNRLFLQRDRLLLLSTIQMLAVAVDLDGTFRQGYDLAAVLEIPEEDRDSVHLSGASVDGAGNLLLSVAVLFRVFVISPEGAVVTSWGTSGSAPGTFGNAGGLCADERGRTYVVDKNRRVVIVFDENRALLTEFGGDPGKAGQLGLPSGVVCDGAGHVYVTQVGRRGVWVYDAR